MTTWYYYDSKDRKVGPATGEQLKEFAKNGRITPETIVETEDGKTAPAGKVKGLTFAVAILAEAEVDDTGLVKDLHEFLAYEKQNNYLNTKKFLEAKGKDKWQDWKKAAEKGIFEGLYLHGMCCVYHVGVSTSMDYDANKKESVRWLCEAVKKGDTEARSIAIQTCVRSFYQSAKRGDAGAVQVIRCAAEHGSAEGQCRLGLCYLKGSGVRKDREEAIKWLSQAAEQGHKEAIEQRQRVVEQETSDVVERQVSSKLTKIDEADMEEAIKSAKRDLKEFIDYAIRNEDVEKYLEEKSKQRLSDWTRAEISGIPEGQTLVGLCYECGIFGADEWGHKIDDSLTLYRKAAKQGNAEAQCRLGFCYGNAENPDHVEAVKLFRQAAEQGHAEGQVALGMGYYYGRGISRDEVAATKWLHKAAEQGHRGATGLLQNIVEWAKMAKEYRQAAELGDAESQCRLGEYYYNGWGVPKDDAESVNWYRKASEQEHGEAQYRLGCCYARGEGIPYDDMEAINCFRKSAEGGYAAGQTTIGIRYFYGATCEEPHKCHRRNSQEGDTWNRDDSCFHCPQSAISKLDGVKWVYKAAEQGDEQAWHYLSIWALSPEGMKAKVPEWLHGAAQRGYWQAIEILKRISEIDAMTPLLE